MGERLGAGKDLVPGLEDRDAVAGGAPGSVRVVGDRARPRLDDSHAGVARRFVAVFGPDLVDAYLVTGNVADFDLVLLGIDRRPRRRDKRILVLLLS